MENHRHIIINIGRQIGAGGHDIGQLLAREFGAKYYDRELLALAAKESGISERHFERHDENRRFPLSILHLPFGSHSDYHHGMSGDQFFQFQSDAILRAASEGSCVFVGRCADYVLRELTDTVNVFVTAPLEFRVARVMEREALGHDAALKQIQQRESGRASYYNYYTGKRWGAAESYDLCVDSSLLGIERTASLIAVFVRQKLGMD